MQVPVQRFLCQAFKSSSYWFCCKVLLKATQCRPCVSGKSTGLLALLISTVFLPGFQLQKSPGFVANCQFIRFIAGLSLCQNSGYPALLFLSFTAGSGSALLNSAKALLC